nr:DUF1674 domain-containing protein [Stenotrophomonas ginsengisoli]
MIGQTTPTPETTPDTAVNDQQDSTVPKPEVATEVGGRGGLDPVRYGDWEKNGRCIDF